ncbi:MAG TPA: ThuA domain-containing protein [Tepidisphaeraceae bacterium]|nr:ThuA domain-containing protein [Tepidisphaeraceae bacterium]
MNRRIGLLVIGFIVLAVCVGAYGADQRHRVLLIDGQNNHDWRSTTPMIKAALERSGLFVVTVATTPATSAPAGDWAKLDVHFGDFAAVVSNFTDFGAAPAPKKFLDDLSSYVRNGGALVVVHAATSGMNHYPEYSRLVGMGWRDVQGGDRLYLDESGKAIRQLKGQGEGTVHGKPFQWAVTMWAAAHPVCAGLPRVWQHEVDELWGAPRGVAENVEILATAVPPETQRNEPVIWTVRYGKGRVFVNMLGHDANAMRCVGFQTILARGCEWAISGRVTLAVPESFPTREKTSLFRGNVNPEKVSGTSRESGEPVR